MLCTDGTDAAVAALRAGYALVGSDQPTFVVTVIADDDPTLVTGTGIAGGVMTPDELDADTKVRRDAGKAVVATTAEALDLPDAEEVVLVGSPGQAICEFAQAETASAIIVGTRGHGRFKRAFLGSVSDYIVRNASCPVIVTGDADAADE